MSFSNEQRNDFADRLHRAARTGTQVPMLTAEVPFEVKEAYVIQEALIQKRIDEGHPLIGMKMGLTSLAKKMEQMGGFSDLWSSDLRHAFR